MIRINIKEEYFWKKHTTDNIILWLKGYLFNKTTKQLINDFSPLNINDIKDYLIKLDGQFALVAQTENWTMMAVDKIRSIPLFYAKNNNNWSIDSQAPSLVKKANLRELNKDAILSFKMSGYTVGEDTLYQDLNSLISGQCVVFENSKNPQKIQYYQYQPWEVINKNNEEYQQELKKVTLKILQKTIDSLNGRQVIIPLSAGNDSRLIVSGLKYLGYKNVKCYSYGIKGNFEAKIAKIIAQKLGYEFKFIPLTIREERKFYQSQKFKDYLDFADNCLAIQYFQSLSTIPRLKSWIAKDAVFINGGTGDFISGGHIYGDLQKDNSQLLKKQRLAIIFNETIKKHFSLWGSLKTKNNLANIKQQLKNEIPIKLTTCDKDHGIYEYSEFINRQSKYVISGQRAYEFYGYEWRLPLWDDEYLRFWQQVPLELKAKQKLYNSMLKTENWAGVWGDDIPVNKKNIRPIWIIPLRFIAKLFFALLGKKGKEWWHQFEINIFYYFMDVTRMICIASYSKVIKSIFQKPKNHVSWQVYYYLEDKDI